MVFEHLRIRPGQRISTFWGNSLVDALELCYGLGKRGDPDKPYYQLYGYYGYFFSDLFVAGKRVLKDGDPITLYDIHEPAKQRIKQAIDQSIVRDIRDVVTRISMDEYGRVGVIIVEPIDEYGRVKTTAEVVIDETTLRRALREELAPARTTPEKVLSSTSIDPGSSAEFTVSNMVGYSALVVTVRASYDPSATKGVRVRWLYSPDGTNFDSPEDAEAQGNYEDLSFAAGATRQRTLLIPILSPYIKVQIVNLDDTYTVTVDAWRHLLR